MFLIEHYGRTVKLLCDCEKGCCRFREASLTWAVGEENTSIFLVFSSEKNFFFFYSLILLSRYLDLD